MKIYQLPTYDFCDVNYSKVPKRGDVIIREGALFGGNTVHRNLMSFTFSCRDWGTGVYWFLAPYTPNFYFLCIFSGSYDSSWNTMAVITKKN